VHACRASGSRCCGQPAAARRGRRSGRRRTKEAAQCLSTPAQEKRLWRLKPLNDHESDQGGGGLRRRGQASGGRHTHGGQCGKTGPPQRVWGNSVGDSRRCYTTGRPLPSPTQKENMQGVRGGGHLPAPAQKERMQGVRGGEHLPAPAHQEPMQGVRGGEHLPAPAPKEPMQRVRGGEPLPAPAQKEHMQGERGGEHLPAPAQKKHMQGVRGGEHLPAPAPEDQLQGLPTANHRGWR